ncbi:MAG: KH domain-containing protein [Firmicutes bacterium]|jgi:predicted RNA-binding protein YlqC (UPF0109 family)|nr:KH domain-containing protein [Bacillota bacterium]
MKEFIEVMAKALVENPDQVIIEESEVEDRLVYRLNVAPEDMGRVIGHQGRIAKAMRTMLKAAGGRTKKRIQLDIVDSI